MDRCVYKAFISSYREMEAFVLFIDYEKRLAEIWDRHLMEAPLIRAAAAESSEPEAAEKAEIGIKSLLTNDNREFHSDQKFYGELDIYLDPRHNHARPGEGEPGSGLDFIDGIENEALLEAMLQLNPREREIIVLHLVDGLSLCRIAGLWDTPASTIRNIYMRAKNKIKKYF